MRRVGIGENGLAIELRTAETVMPGLVPGIHVFAATKQERRGWPGQGPAMTKNQMIAVQRPTNFGGRLALKASTPSLKSSDCRSRL